MSKSSYNSKLKTTSGKDFPSFNIRATIPEFLFYVE